MLGQNCSVVCTNEGGHRDTFSNDCSEHAIGSSCIAYQPYYYLVIEHTGTYNSYLLYLLYQFYR